MNTKQLFMSWKTLTIVDDPCFNDPLYEHENLEKLLQEQWSPDPRTYLDIGAHQGIYTSFLSAMIGNGSIVYAFEPNPDNWAVLLTNSVHRANQDAVAVFPLSLGRGDGTVTLRCWRNRPAASGMGRIIVENETPEFVAPTRVVALDSLKFPWPVEFIKIDVNHCEWEVLAGGINTILRYRPRILIEIYTQQIKEQIQSFCRAHRFAVEEWQATVSSVNRISNYLFIRPQIL